MAEAMLPRPNRRCEEREGSGFTPYYREALNGDFERAFELCVCGDEVPCSKPALGPPGGLRVGPWMVPGPRGSYGPTGGL